MSLKERIRQLRQGRTAGSIANRIKRAIRKHPEICRKCKTEFVQGLLHNLKEGKNNFWGDFCDECSVGLMAAWKEAKR